jgi:hypothetical protein
MHSIRLAAEKLQKDMKLTVQLRGFGQMDYGTGGNRVAGQLVPYLQ